MEKWTLKDGVTDTKSFQNTGEHMPVMYPRSDEERSATAPGEEMADPAAHEATDGSNADQM